MHAAGRIPIVWPDECGFSLVFNFDESQRVSLSRCLLVKDHKLVNF